MRFTIPRTTLGREADRSMPRCEQRIFRVSRRAPCARMLHLGTP